MLKLSNPNKIFWEKEKISKGDLLQYYTTVAPYILPYLKNRPLVLHRFPDGIKGEHFYQKESGISRLPSFVKTIGIQHETKVISYFMVQNVDSLLYVVNLGSIELHPFNARITHLDYPDYFVFDLDPFEISFAAIINVARTLHEFLEENEIPHFCKTSGGSGLHVCVPLHGKYPYSVIEKFAALVARIVHEKIPEITSLERDPQKRKKKVYIDTLQNRKMQTIVCPYSVRGFPGAPVATPLQWNEVKESLDPMEFNLRTVPERLQKKGDLLKLLLKKTINLPKILKILEKNN